MSCNLTHEEKTSPLWHKLKEHYESRLARLREENDGPLDDVETAKLRGKIAEVRSLLKLESAAIAPDDQQMADQ